MAINAIGIEGATRYKAVTSVSFTLPDHLRPTNVAITLTGADSHILDSLVTSSAAPVESVAPSHNTEFLAMWSIPVTVGLKPGDVNISDNGVVSVNVFIDAETKDPGIGDSILNVCVHTFTVPFQACSTTALAFLPVDSITI